MNSSRRPAWRVEFVPVPRRVQRCTDAPASLGDVVEQLVVERWFDERWEVVGRAAMDRQNSWRWTDPSIPEAILSDIMVWACWENRLSGQSVHEGVVYRWVMAP